MAVDGEVVLIELEETARETTVCIAEHTDNDLAARNAVDGMRCREIVLEHLVGVDHFLDARIARVCRIEDVNSGRALAGDDQVVASQPFGVKRRRTGVPAEVVKLVAHVRHFDSVDQFTVRL